MTLCGKSCLCRSCTREPGIADDDGITPCVYCGDPATTKDHTTALSTRFSGGRSAAGRYIGKTVPSCKGCNCAILRALPIIDVESRKLYVASSLRQRLKKANYIPWSEDELAELGPRLRRSLETEHRGFWRLLHRTEFAELAAWVTPWWEAA